LEHIVPAHLLEARAAQVGGRPAVGVPSVISEAAPPPETAAIRQTTGGLQDPENRFADASADDLVGALPRLVQAHAVDAAMLLRRVLEITRKVTKEHPEGEMSIHRALKFATGNEKLTATKAADLIKKVLKPLSHDREGPMADPVLREVLEEAKRMRRRRAKRSGAGEGSR